MAFFEDPLARRELSGVARRWPMFVARLLIGLCVLWAVAYLWQRSDVVYGYGGYSALSSLAREVFAAYFGGLMGLLPLLAVTTAADLITKEVRNGTLGLLFLTPLTPWRIAVGKWKAAMAQTLLILLAGGPVAAICVYLGGIGAWEILWGTALPLATAAFAAAVSLFYSTVFRGPAMAIIASVLSLIAGILGPVWLLASSGPRGEGFELLVRIHPVFAALVAAEPRAAFSPGLSEEAWISATPVALLCAGLVLLATAARLPGRMRLLPGPGFLARLMGRFDAFFDAINVGRVRFFSRSGEVWQERALLWKELRLRAAGKLRHAARFAVGLLILSLLPFMGSDRHLRDWITVFLWCFSGLLVLQAVVIGVALFAHEREGRQWDILLSTPLSVSDILWAKIAGGLAGMAPTAVAALLYLSLIASLHSFGAELWWSLTLSVGLFTVFAILVSAAASLRARTLRGAFGMSMGLLLGILCGIPLAAGLLDEMRIVRFREREVLAPTNPAWYLVEASEGFTWRGRVDVDFDYLSVYLFLYAAASVALIVYMRVRFNRLSGRV